MTAVKICGITSLAGALAAVAAGADYLGFNFYLKSPRYIDPAACARITAVLKEEHPQVKRVGVFVNMPADQVQAVLDACALDLAQLHGDETPADLALLSPRAFKAFRGAPAGLGEYARAAAPACLVDASVRGAYGGTGRTADWPAAERLARRVPLLLAGGLTPENVTEAVRAVRPYGVDTASGVESAPGVKDAARMRAFVDAVRAADRELGVERRGEEVR
jgi:phosphoribosylanthranilate isomerase